MFRNRPPSVINWIESTALLPSKRQRIPIACDRLPQGSVLGPILFVIHVNDLADNLTIDHLLYADNGKPIALPKKSRCLPTLLGR